MRVRFKNQSNGIDKMVKRNIQNRFSCQKYHSSLLSEGEERFKSANAFDLAQYFCFADEKSEI